MDKKTHSEEKVKTSESTNASTAKLAFCHEEGVEPYEPWKNRNLTHPLNNMGALFHMIKGSLGSGILAMPVAFKNGGLWVSLFCAVLVGVVYTHCVHILIYSCQILCTRLKLPRLGFAEIAEAAFRTGPTKWRKYSTAAKNIVDLGLFLGYYACCIVYVVFTASSLKQVIEHDFDVSMDVRLYILAVTVFVLPIGIIRNLKYLVPFSFIAIVALTFGCCFVLYDIFQDLPPLSSRPVFTSWSHLPLFFCTMIYAVDGIGTVLPIENAMSNPQRFLGCPGILNASMVWLIALYGTMGFFGYLRYGEETAGSITLNISSSTMGQTVKLMVILNVLCSYGLFLYVPCEIVWRNIEGFIGKSRKTFKYYTMRVVLILLTVVIATIVPDLEPFVGLVGAICSSTLVLFFPPVIELVTFWEDDKYMGPYRWKFYKNYILIILWFITLVTGAHISLQKIIELYQ
ncbi:proton-coupled amino acid transporter-like protein pathetic [Macrosteles quadrilineatus]|uniref:proton-coupled amino acid transporter-like protein pathetic n=1 Tax=Macrosteles quadrilineatus TaxID=74068 RepID=UPI0023E20A83|nr:proton-coupled amino acid transporter-like protein pathetic [Macrosteles quadrilineatus]